jgi:hypothetical protein
MEYAEASSPVSLFPPDLRSLDMNARRAGLFLRHLRSLPTFPEFQSIKLGEMARDDYGALVLYLQRAGPALQSLSFEKAWESHLGNPSYFLCLI